MSDTPLAGVTIELLNFNQTPIDSDPNTTGVQPTTTVTDANGNYSFDNVAPGLYLVKETNPSEFPEDVVDGDTSIDDFFDTIASNPASGFPGADPPGPNPASILRRTCPSHRLVGNRRPLGKHFARPAWTAASPTIPPTWDRSAK